MDFIVILLDDWQALFVGIEGAINAGLIELNRLNICPLAFCCVDMSHFVVTVFITEKSDSRTL
jgi:hypothetical protein